MGTLRIIEKPEGYKLGRLCVLKEYRGLHFGEDLVRVRERVFGPLLTFVSRCASMFSSTLLSSPARHIKVKRDGV
jgi:hypothetical protein